MRGLQRSTLIDWQDLIRWREGKHGHGGGISRTEDAVAPVLKREGAVGALDFEENAGYGRKNSSPVASAQLRRRLAAIIGAVKETVGASDLFAKVAKGMGQ